MCAEATAPRLRQPSPISVDRRPAEGYLPAVTSAAPTSQRSWAPAVLLETATLISQTGNAVAMIVIPWIILERTGSAAAAGIVGAATALPLLASSLLSGTIVDIVGRRRTAVLADVASCAAVAAIPLVDATVGVDTLTIAALAALGAVFDPAGISARESMLPAAARAAGVRLDRLNGVHEAVWGAAFLLGPGLGGILIATVGPVAALWSTAIGFAVAAVLTSLLRLPLSGAPMENSKVGIWRSTAEGLRFVWDDRLLRALAIYSAVLVGIYLPVEGVILPVHFEALDRPTALGLVITAMGAGGVVGSLAYGAWGRHVPRRALFVCSMLATSAALMVMAFLPPVPALLTAGACVGLAFGPINPLINLAMQARSPERLRGRVVGVLSSSMYAAGPLGYVIVGPLVEAFGVEEVFVAIGAGIVVIALSSALLPSLRALDDAELDEIADEVEPEHPLEPPLHPPV